MRGTGAAQNRRRKPRSSSSALDAFQLFGQELMREKTEERNENGRDLEEEGGQPAARVGGVCVYINKRGSRTVCFWFMDR